jgi:hypothetical protein
MNPIKRRFYFDSEGRVFFTLDLYGETTIEKDIQDFKALSERNRETFDVLELPFGAYAQDFAECNGYRVNVETKTLEFSYPDPNAPEAPQIFEKPLSERIAEQEQQISELNLQDISMMEMLIERGLI